MGCDGLVRSYEDWACVRNICLRVLFLLSIFLGVFTRASRVLHINLKSNLFAVTNKNGYWQHRCNNCPYVIKPGIVP